MALSVWSYILAMSVGLPPSPQDPSAASLLDMDIEDLLLLPVGQLEAGAGTLLPGMETRLLPAVVEVVTSDDIALMGVADLRELLQNVAGTFEASSSMAPFLDSVTHLRVGPSSTRILLIIDDAIILPMMSFSYNAYSVPIQSIERVEVLRGSAAVLYGSGAMAGVIRVVTKKPAGNSVEAMAVGDVAHAVGDGRLGGGWRGGVLGRVATVRVDAQVRETQDYHSIIRRPGGSPDKTPHQVASRSMISTAALGGLSAQLRLNDMEGSVRSFGGEFGADAPRNGARQTVVGVQASFAADRDAWRIQVALDGELRRRSIGIGAFPTALSGPASRLHVDDQVYMLRAGIDYLGDWLRWSAELQYARQGLLSHDLVVEDSSERHPFAPTPGMRFGAHEASSLFEGQVQLTPNIDAVVAVRLTANSPAASGLATLTPEEADAPARILPMGRAALVWQLQRHWTAKVIFGHAYRMPCPSEVYSEVPGFFAPNVDLRPETQDTVEAVVDYSTRAFDGRLELYYGRLFDIVEANLRQVPAFYSNVSEPFSVVGGHAIAQLNISGRWAVAATSAFHWAAENSDEVALAIPRFVGSAKVVTNRPLLSGVLHVALRVRSHAGVGGSAPFADLDASAQWRLNERVSLHATVLNGIAGSYPTVFGMPYHSATIHNLRAIRLGCSATW